MNSIRIENLTKRFRKILAVDSLTLDVDAGKVTGFVGPNGAGKTTTLRCLLGLVRPTKGGATITGRPYGELNNPLRTVGAVLQGSDFYPGRSGRDHLRILSLIADVPDERVDEVLAEVGLTESARKKVKGYSSGMRQRLAIASALVSDPEILVLDEPTNSLDPAGIKWFRELIRARADRGGTVFVSSHNLAELSLAADDVVIINNGRLVTAGPMSELVTETATLEDVFLEATQGPGAMR